MFYGINFKDGDGFELFLVIFFMHDTSSAVLNCFLLIYVHFNCNYCSIYSMLSNSNFTERVDLLTLVTSKDKWFLNYKKNLERGLRGDSAEMHH